MRLYFAIGQIIVTAAVRLPSIACAFYLLRRRVNSLRGGLKIVVVGSGGGDGAAAGEAVYYLV